MSKWNRWKLIHKETGLTFKQYQQSRGSADKDDIVVMLESGMPAIYNNTPYYPSIRYLNNKEWRIEMKPASLEGVDK